MLYIFDFDGTIADTHQSIVATTQLTLRAMGREERAVSDITSYIGLALRDMFLGFGMSEAEATEACEVYRAAFDEVAEGNVFLYAGVAETLRRLHAEGHTLTIASSRNTASLRHLLGAFSLTELFTHILGADSVTRHKPHPEAVLRLLALTQRTKEDALVVGDATFDILMGKGAGCRTVAVTYGNQSREQLLTARPDRLIDTFAELLGI